MNESNRLTYQAANETEMRGAIYVTIDGILRYCFIAPLLELPIDFKEWYKPNLSHECAVNFA